MAQGATAQRDDRIRNVRVLTRNDPSLENRNSVSESFIQNKSMQAEADRFQGRESANDAKRQALAAETAANDEQYRRSVDARDRARIQAALRARAQSTGKIATLAQINPASPLVDVVFGFKLYIVQLILAIFAAVGLFIQGGQEALSNGNLLQQFTSIFTELPAQAMGGIGTLAWGLVISLSFGIFLIFLVRFKRRRINPFNTVGSTFVTYTLLALNVIPIINIFPWLLIWIVYINASNIGFGKLKKT